MSQHVRFRLIALSFSVISSLMGCNPDSYRDYVKPEELSDLQKESKTSSFRKVGGVDLWSEGVPDRKYRILGVIHDLRRNMKWRLESYDADIAKAVQRAGGDGGIILKAENKVVDKYSDNCSSFAPNNQQCGPDTGAASRGPNQVEEVTVYSENRESTSVPLEYKDSHILVIRYLD